MRQLVLPIKDDHILFKVEDTLLNNFKAGRRNFTIFQLGKATLLRVSDVMKLKYHDVFDDTGEIIDHVYIHDKKTNKPNLLYLNPVKKELKLYNEWLIENEIHSDWLFPSTRDHSRHISEKQFYKVMAKVGELLNLDYLGTHTIRKTGAYRVYTQSKFNIALVMNLLNHSTESMTLAYLGLDQSSREDLLDKINFG